MGAYVRGDYFTPRITIKDVNKAKVDPTTVTITITDPCDIIVLTATAMSRDDPVVTGAYNYAWAIPSAATYGRYKSKITATSSGATVAIERDEFYVLPWDALKDVRQTMGLSGSEKSIDDNDLANTLWNAYKWALRDVHEHHYRERPRCNPDTGAGFDGSNTAFQTKHYPIADIWGDGTVTGYGQQSCGTDISFDWINNAGARQTGYVTVTDARNGEITITQNDGSSAIPQDNEGVFLDYWTEYWGFNDEAFQQAAVRRACHEISKRFAEMDKLTLADVKANNPLIVVDPRIWEKEYKNYINQLRVPLVGGIG